ncbi:hypothetical protein cyc_04376 [Cyclospora cayetanensis]|uniref:PPPDE domain-containing protein n=1 Tax=Cyclospora cayetanensis TaxID=88456 RepID=A0A1D3CSK0_9EIME|nr:hypothetical protein cyc_04376 [Cyclospora cayetanensis]
MPGTDVFLNVYKINGSPDWCAPCGLYHTSVQIGELEYSFGEGVGVTYSTHNPRVDGVHGFLDGTYEYSLHMGVSTLSALELSNVISTLQRVFQGNKYDLINRNCNHFSDTLLKAVVNKGIPSYINRASRYGNWLSCLLPDAWRGPSEEGGPPASDMPSSICGVFGGNGQRLGEGRSGSGIGEAGYRILGQLLKISDCLKPSTLVRDERIMDGTLANGIPVARDAL